MFLNAVIFLAMAGAPNASALVAAEVNDEVVTMREVVIMVTPKLKSIAQKYDGTQLMEMQRDFVENAVNNLVEQKLLAHAARENGVEVKDETVDEEVEKLAQRVGGWPLLLDALSGVDMSIGDKRDQIKESLLVRRLLSQLVLPRVYAAPADIKNYYNANKKQFVRPSEYCISQIIIWKSNYKSSDEMGEKVLEVKKALSSGGDFSSLAKKYSDGPHAKEGGDWGFVKPKDILQELSSELAKMKPGQVVGPVQTRVGYHFVKLTDVKEPAAISLSEAYHDIETYMRERAYVMESEKLVRELRRKSFIRIHREAISKALGL